jgi:hypothetical protein
MVVMILGQGLGIGEVAPLLITLLFDCLYQHVLGMRVLITIVLVSDMKGIKGLCDRIEKWATVEVEFMNELSVPTLCLIF